MKKTAIMLVLGVLSIAPTTCFHALAEPPGPIHHGVGFFGGPPGPPPGPPFPAGGFHDGPPGPPPQGGEFPGLWQAPPDLIDKLKLTDDQLKQIRLAYVDFQDKTRKARNTLMGLHDEKRTMLIAGKIDQARLAKLDEETTKLSSEVMAEELRMKREHLSKLTPEQLDNLADFLSKKRIPHGRKMMAK